LSSYKLKQAVDSPQEEREQRHELANKLLLLEATPQKIAKQQAARTSEMMRSTSTIAQVNPGFLD